MAGQILSESDVAAGIAGLSPEWSGSARSLTRSIEFADGAAAAEFVNELSPISDSLDHHADLEVRQGSVDIVLTTHSAGGVTALDMQLAGKIDELAASLRQAAGGKP